MMRREITWLVLIFGLVGLAAAFYLLRERNIDDSRQAMERERKDRAQIQALRLRSNSKADEGSANQMPWLSVEIKGDVFTVKIENGSSNNKVLVDDKCKIIAIFPSGQKHEETVAQWVGANNGFWLMPGEAISRVLALSSNRPSEIIFERTERSNAWSETVRTSIEIDNP